VSGRIAVVLAGDRAAFRPGEAVAGAADWRLEAAPERVEVRLFWYTQGKGTQDVGIVDRQTFERPGQEASQGFRFRLPEGPYSFSGKLISLAWAVEVVAEAAGGEGEVARREIVVSPTGGEILLGGGGGGGGEGGAGSGDAGDAARADGPGDPGDRRGAGPG
jgi:hypothetical protein